MGLPPAAGLAGCITVHTPTAGEVSQLLTCWAPVLSQLWSGYLHVQHLLLGGGSQGFVMGPLTEQHRFCPQDLGSKAKGGLNKLMCHCPMWKDPVGTALGTVRNFSQSVPCPILVHSLAQSLSNLSLPAPVPMALLQPT